MNSDSFTFLFQVSKYVIKVQTIINNNFFLLTEQSMDWFFRRYKLIESFKVQTIDIVVENY